MDELNYHQLRLFWAVAREGHLTRASKKLNLTPQTVSGQIRSIEETFGEKLFDRVNRRMVLTDAGRVTLHYADDIIERFYALLMRRSVMHPAVAAICEAAQVALAASGEE